MSDVDLDAPGRFGATAGGITRAGLHRAYDEGTTVDPTRFYPRSGPLPAVLAVEGMPPGWNEVGMRRTLRLSGRGSVVERIVLTDSPRHFAYELSEFSGVFGLLVTGARADWRFDDAATAGASGAGTRIRWTYVFHPRPGRGGIVRLIVQRFWGPYMARVLPGIIAELDRTSPPPVE